jgi:hypothetical protein
MQYYLPISRYFKLSACKQILYFICPRADILLY